MKIDIKTASNGDSARVARGLGSQFPCTLKEG